ncbi:hypothetical protein [Halorhodospira neutriphila]|nr:hypothetical protein [Halorhodospira neutriphila]
MSATSESDPPEELEPRWLAELPSALRGAVYCGRRRAGRNRVVR